MHKKIIIINKRMTTIQNNSNIVSAIYNSRKILLELMEEQGFFIDDYANFSIKEVNDMKQNNQLDMLLEKKEEDSITKRKNKIYIRYYLNKAIRPNNIDEMIDDLFLVEEVLKKEDTLFIIVKDNMNETLMNKLIHLWEKDGVFVVLVSIRRLQFNILKHVLNPKFVVLKSTEVEDVMKQKNISSLSEFPDISRFDPVAQVIGLRPGMVCKIIRPSKTAVESLYYRVCV
jgi:DNA-directed RNA polymerase subunit H (RpoH/RPB5)